jgi:hypothetical protein
MFTIWVEECHWGAFGVGAERLPSDHKTNLERTVCVGRGLVRSKGLFENIQLA